jgi:hypothetical protein
MIFFGVAIHTYSFGASKISQSRYYYINIIIIHSNKKLDLFILMIRASHIQREIVHEFNKSPILFEKQILHMAEKVVTNFFAFLDERTYIINENNENNEK